jgi:hypothetical protein
VDRRLFAVCTLTFVGAGCAPLDAGPARAAEASIRETTEAGGREDPAAAAYLALAERELARARMLAGAGDGAGARGWARRAAADADVARMLAIGASVRASARRSEDDAEAIFRELSGHAP